MSDFAEKENFNERGFWSKLKNNAKQIGQGTIEKVLWLFYAFQRPDTPLWAKGVIGGALAYFVLPVDAIPDFLPGVGYTDDLGAIGAAIGIVSFYINDDVKQQAKQKLLDWFG